MSRGKVNYGCVLNVRMSEKEYVEFVNRSVLFKLSVSDYARKLLQQELKR